MKTNFNAGERTDASSQTNSVLDEIPSETIVKQCLKV